MLKRTPNGLREIVATFGHLTPNFEARYIVSFDLPYPLLYAGKTVRRARCHRLLVDNFITAFSAIRAAGLESECRNYGGIYANRSIRGISSHPSTHSWGIAIDLEPAKYPLGNRKRFPDAVIQCWELAGFYYGGNFRKRPDPMHFQFTINY